VWDLRSGKTEKTLGSDIKFSSMQSTLDEQVICATSGKKAIFFEADTHDLVKSFDLSETLSSSAYAMLLSIGGLAFFSYLFFFCLDIIPRAADL